MLSRFLPRLTPTIPCGSPVQARNKGVQPAAVEPQAVDQGAVGFEPKDARLGIARLRPRRHRADFDKAETAAEQRVGDAGILVETGSDADRVRKIATPQALRQDRRIGARERGRQTRRQAPPKSADAPPPAATPAAAGAVAHRARAPFRSRRSSAVPSPSTSTIARSPAAGNWIGTMLPVSTTMPRLSGLPIVAVLLASQASALSGLPITSPPLPRPISRLLIVSRAGQLREVEPAPVGDRRAQHAPAFHTLPATIAAAVRRL